MQTTTRRSFLKLMAVATIGVYTLDWLWPFKSHKAVTSCEYKQVIELLAEVPLKKGEMCGVTIDGKVKFAGTCLFDTVAGGTALVALGATDLEHLSLYSL